PYPPPFPTRRSSDLLPPPPPLLLSSSAARMTSLLMSALLNQRLIGNSNPKGEIARGPCLGGPMHTCLIRKLSVRATTHIRSLTGDRKSTRLNSSHVK